MNTNHGKSPAKLLAFLFPDGMIFDLPIPFVLAEVIRRGQWKTPSVPVLQRIFPSHEIDGPSFYGPSALHDENMGWRYQKHCPELIGRKSSGVEPGDIDQSKSILIGDLSIDRPIALDYRSSMDDPSVIFLTGDADAQWVEVVPNIERFLSILSMT